MRRFLAPETIQTSAMDCGPAALKTLLEGHGIPASYGRLREACQTGIDGTSIDQIEIAAGEMGLDAEQIMLPGEHVLLAEAAALPAMVVTRQPGGYTHFVVVWRVLGDWVQVMDPGAGRRWMRRAEFLASLHIHSQTVPREAWEEWARSEAFQAPLRARCAALAGRVDPARLDAALRMAAAEGRDVAGVVDGPIPEAYWTASGSGEFVTLRGAVLMRVKGKREGAATPTSRELAAALEEKPPAPLRALLGMVMAYGRLGALAAVAAMCAAATGTAMEALLFRALFDAHRDLALRGQQLAALAAVWVLSAVVLGLEFSAATGVLRMGRRLECTIRTQFLTKLPRLGDRYFQSRPISDMASRMHQVHQLRRAPEMAGAFLRTFFEIAATVVGVAWLYPTAVGPVLLLAGICVGVPLLFQPFLSERDLRMRSHGGALSQYSLDALLGLTAIRAHGAEETMLGRQAVQLTEWARANLSLQRLTAVAEGVQMTAATAVAAWIVWSGVGSGGLLLVYWVLQLPGLGEELASIVNQAPALRNTALRLMEPLDAPEEPVGGDVAVDRGAAVSLVCEGVTVRAGGHVILDDVDLAIAPGSHVAIVGASGAGKSSLAGLFLGWHRAETGHVLVNGAELTPAGLERLRRETAWVDPQVQIWNQSLFENLRYGNGDAPVGRAIGDAGLAPVLEKLPDGLQTVLGEGGSLVSGGEGQRVRIGRALGRAEAKLVILDEPARGLDAGRRKAVLETARERWRAATLLAVTHDVRDTLDFDRVLVMEKGRIVEDGAPRELAARDTAYRRLLDVEDELRRGLWASRKWRRMTIRDGALEETVYANTR